MRDETASFSRYTPKGDMCTVVYKSANLRNIFVISSQIGNIFVSPFSPSLIHTSQCGVRGARVLSRRSSLRERERREVSQNRNRSQDANPNFASLSTTLRGVLSGVVDCRTLEQYQDALVPRLETSRRELKSMAVPPAAQPLLKPVLARTEALYEKIAVALDLVEDFLHDGTRECLEEAISLLDKVGDQMGLGV